MRGIERGKSHHPETGNGQRADRGSFKTRLRQIFSSEAKKPQQRNTTQKYPTWSVSGLDQGYPMEHSYQALVEEDARRRGVPYSEALLDFFCGGPEDGIPPDAYRSEPTQNPQLEIREDSYGNKYYLDSSGEKFFITGI